ncbi:putative DNA excision/repair protein SNF2 [Leptomonas pyrrhocoris]|uniref:Putative DNA excision/repair protein SNF2 n=1 Tax=Leptomonas pyrrhocoris TaxID=157538 RepID=A0A0N0DQR7_LEPPY|nr:putative DNA excision/repair protein SNF2 [Leptomonas pyrrhocoris]KPA73668.1 putative DNA excision/repair protein SNF2 [Leptomonas pyrrhocoris]|eukprot:XP_015652107.1 putative DNA excision/repair protein SNF2 [Leptomonas pyrrhocoris]
MEHDDVLEDLLSWTGDRSVSAAKRTPQRPSLQASCVNTAPSAASKTAFTNKRQTHDSDDDGGGRDGTSTGHAGSHDEAGNQEKARCAPQADSPFSTSTATTLRKEMLQLPDSVQSRLLPHQREGVQWLYARHCKSRACLLADEMGLGKTVQVAAFLGELYRRKSIKTTILIVPPTLVPMWAAALSDWDGADGREMGSLVEIIHNDQRKKRQARWRKLAYGMPCVLLTTYGVLRQDAALMSATLVDYVVLDEAHLIRDARTCAFKSALTLSARHKVALTGTPLMNSFDDMWSVFQFLDGSILPSSRAGFSAISAMLLRGNEKDASRGQREAAAVELHKLRAAIRPFMLRREKKDFANAVASAKEDVVVWVRMSDVQRQQYEAFLESKEVATATPSPPLPGSADVDDVGTNPLLLLTMLSQICNHPWLNLVDAAFTAAVAQPYAAPLMEMGDVFAGSKLWVTLQLLVRCIRQCRKSLVFSHSKRVLRLLGCLLTDWGVTHLQVDSDTPSEHRFAAVQRFNDDPSVWVCLLTRRVGGIGLTFTAATAVVLLDPSWNPSADAQAVDRVHRIGQTGDVVVYRLVTCGTVEEKVYRNQVFKRMAALQSVRAGVPNNGDDEEEVLCDADGADQGDEAVATTTPLSSPTEPLRQQHQASSELYRYFTRLQLRSMLAMDDIDRSSTAEQLEALHPHRVDDDLRRELRRIDGVCDVSDNSCVLMARVDATAAAEEEEEADGLPASASILQTESMQEVDVETSVSPRARCRSESLPTTVCATAVAEGHRLCSPTSLAGQQPLRRRQRVDTAANAEAVCSAYSGACCGKDDVSDAVSGDAEEIQMDLCGIPERTRRDSVHACSQRPSSSVGTPPPSSATPTGCFATSSHVLHVTDLESSCCPPERLTATTVVAAEGGGGGAQVASLDENERASSCVEWEELAAKSTGRAPSLEMRLNRGTSLEAMSRTPHSLLLSGLDAREEVSGAEEASLSGDVRELPLRAGMEENGEEAEEGSVSSAEFASCRSSF